MSGQKHDEGKVRLDLIPIAALRGLGDVLTYGAEKYSERNWEEGIEYHRLYGAALRHLTAWWDREAWDPESGLSHLKHALACISFLTHFEANRRTYYKLDTRPESHREP